MQAVKYMTAQTCAGHMLPLVFICARGLPFPKDAIRVVPVQGLSIYPGDPSPGYLVGLLNRTVNDEMIEWLFDVYLPEQFARVEQMLDKPEEG